MYISGTMSIRVLADVTNIASAPLPKQHLKANVMLRSERAPCQFVLQKKAEILINAIPGCLKAVWPEFFGATKWF